MSSPVLDRESAVPLYAQLDAELRARIADGEWRPNQRIPSENELTKIYGLSRMTTRGVLNTLVAEGLLFRVQGKGTFVAPQRFDAVSPAYQGVREQLEAAGYHTSTVVLSSGIEEASPLVREKLGLPDGATVHAIHRLRSAQDEPLSLHHSYVPASLAPDLGRHDAAGEQLCVILEKHYGLSMKHVVEHLEASAAGTEEAQLLGTRRGRPVLRLEDVISDATSTPFEYSMIVFRGDKIRLGFDYHL
ncbi:GntR family transcriptional regulator [Isoptericola sp. b490]|uniref:GntR family transcriptional regulator n=1 Tax=Actinotalea lenta TaxID=3064654 RepID=UPI0027131601|nr:GntR family transcriptional regulator [Isoptericola sp. b490]MDO8119864.1 GntR family transcriptional regulator [Isoptericola sp. b490]